MSPPMWPGGTAPSGSSVRRTPASPRLAIPACAQDRGQFLVFLDADDRLLPDAVKTGVRHLEANPTWAFVAGHYREIDASQTAGMEWPHRCPHIDCYRELLREPYIAMHATVLFRREALERAGAYDTSLHACEDYDLCLRLAREYPIGCHCSLIAEYRQHAANMTRDPVLMLRSVMAVLHREWRHARSSAEDRRAHRDGVRFWKRYYGGLLARNFRAAVFERRWARAARDLATLLRHYPAGVAACAPPLRSLAALASCGARPVGKRVATGRRSPVGGTR